MKHWGKWLAVVVACGLGAWGMAGCPGGVVAVRFARARVWRRSVEEAVEDVFGRRPEVREMAGNAGGSLRILVFKREGLVEVSAPGWDAPRTYPMTARSGTEGPKLREGDRQIPEGFYRVESLNPNSLYHLALRLDYPNGFDRDRAREDGRSGLGGDIMIHGSDCSVGCVAVGDRAIEEIFCCAAAVGPENVEVVIAPFDLRQGCRGEREAAGPAWYPALLEELDRALRAE